MKVLFNTIYYLLIGSIVCLGLLLMASMLPLAGGIKVKVVMSGSMEPTIKTGGVVIIKPESAYAVGDVVTFGADTKTRIPTTHRIVAIEREGPNALYQTKGDANDAPDPVTQRLRDVHGKVILTVPYLGYVLDFAKKPIGFALLVGVPATLIIFEELAKIYREVIRLRRKKALNHENADPT